MPGDEEMERNRDIYLEEEGADEAWLRPRREAADSRRREKAEERLLAFVDEKFKKKEEERVKHVVLEAFDPKVRRIWHSLC